MRGADSARRGSTRVGVGRPGRTSSPKQAILGCGDGAAAPAAGGTFVAHEGAMPNEARHHPTHSLALPSGAPRRHRRLPSTALSWLGAAVFLGSSLASCGPVGPEATESLGTVSDGLTATQVEPLAASANWTTSTAAGSLGTFLADVTGGSTNAADLVLLNTNGIQVRRSPGGQGPLNSASTWLSTGFSGSVMTRLADVNNDNRADVIAVNANDIRVRLSTGSAFGSSQTWSTTAFTGTLGTFFADVTGDKRADAITVNSGNIRVRRATSSSFSTTVETWSTSANGTAQFRFHDVTGDGKADAIIVSSSDMVVRPANVASNGFDSPQTWAPNGFVGTRDNLFADVTGDGLADYVAVNDTNVQMRRSGRFYFGHWETLSTTGGATGLAARAFADVTGDGRADYVEVPTSGALRVRSRQDRRIPVRFVQLAPDCGSEKLVSDAQLDKILVDVNTVWRDVGVAFYAESPVGTQDCGSRSRSQVSLSPSFTDITWPTAPPMPLSELAKAVRFNSGCPLGDDAGIQSVTAREQLGWALARCSRTKEIVVYIGKHGSSVGNAPGWGKVLVMDPGDGNVTSNSWPILAHELGHYLGASHVYDDEIFGTGNYTDPLTGRVAPMSMSWDLVLSTATNPPTAFKNRAEAQAQEFSLQVIGTAAAPGWHCPSNDTINKPCPTPPHLPGTIRVPAGGPSGPFWDSGDWRLAGLSMLNPGAAGGYAVNIMSYGYPGNSQSSFLPQRFSLSQIEIIQNALASDVVTPFLTATGAPALGHRTTLGTDDAPQGIRFVMTGAVAKAGPGTLAANGNDTWVIGTNAYDANGNQAWQFEPRTGGWYARPMGAQQIAVPSDWSVAAPGVSPWAIVTSGEVRRYDGSTFAALPNGAGFCAQSVAVGPLQTGPLKYAWAIGCPETVNHLGEFRLFRYSHVDGAGGWVGTAIWGKQVAVDGRGRPWVLRASGTLNGLGLDANDMPASLSPYPAPGGGVQRVTAGAHRNAFLPPVVLANDGHLHILSHSTFAFSWYDAGATPVVFDRIAGSIPYLWALEPDGRVWYQR
jgi:hypothetical protein